MKTYILPYKRGSESVNRLRTLIKDTRVLRPENSTFKGNNRKVVVINWGNSMVPEEWNSIVLNKNSLNATNKLIAQKMFESKGIKTPDLSRDIDSIKSDLIVCRALTSSRGGKGITIIKKEDRDKINTSKYKYYTSYIKKTREYRVHVFREQAFFIQAKIGLSVSDFQIRNYKNGWKFSSVSHIESVLTDDLLSDMEQLAVDAVRALNLDFGGVDIIYNRFKGFFVLEVNTAVGLCNITSDKYARMFSEYLDIIHDTTDYTKYIDERG